MAVHFEVINHVVKRSAQALDQYSSGSRSDGPDMPQPSKVGVALIILTAIVCGLGITLIRYTLWSVVGTLAMVEQPQTSVIISGFKDSNNGNKGDDPNSIDVGEAVILNEVPITSKIRTTIRHLHRQAGWKSRYRGMSLAIVSTIVSALLMQLVTAILGRSTYSMRENMFMGWGFVSQLLAGMVTSLVLVRWSVAWVHIIISEPSSKPWYRRIPPMSTFRKVALPTLAVDVASLLNILVPAAIFVAMQGSQPDLDRQCIWGSITAFSAYLFMGIFVTLPFMIAQARISASLLPEDHESIVPFDRTFNGRVVPEALGGKGVLSWKDALQTVDAEARTRLIKLFAKFILIDIGLHLFFAALLVAQVAIFFGPHVKALLDYYTESN